MTALDGIFTKLKQSGSEILFMTPNMMNTKVSCHLTDPLFREIAQGKCQAQEDGILDLYVNSAKQLCQKREIPVCDCYAKWKAMQAAGVDVTELLANKIDGYGGVFYNKSRVNLHFQRERGTQYG